MKIFWKLVRLHRYCFFAVTIFTIISALVGLLWNRFLANLIDEFGGVLSRGFAEMEVMLIHFVIVGVSIIFFCAVSECLSLYFASYFCELIAHEMRMGYSRFYFQSDIQVITKLNVGEEQSAMQNELTEISSYLHENLFSLIKQFFSFIVTVTFLFCMNIKLTLFSILPVVPLISYCFCSSKIIKGYTEVCQESRRQVNGIAATLLDLFPVIQVYGAYALTSAAIEERLLEWRNSNIMKERITARLMSLSGLLSFVPLLVLLGYGGVMVINGEISVGVFYVFINLSGNVSGFLQNMPNIYAGFRRFDASINRLEKKMVL